MTKKAIALISCFLLIIAGAIIYIFSELYTENDINKAKQALKNTDAIKFKEEYESKNTDARVLNISEDNPFIYSSAEDIVKRINNKETFIVYFGFETCPWCRSIIETAITSAKDNKIDKIYYVNVSNIRDKYELDDKNKLVKTVEGSSSYYELLDLLKDILTDYEPLTYTVKKKTKTVKVNEKRIYAPTFIMVKNGNAIKSEDGISSLQKESNAELTKDILCEEKEKFDCFFEAFNTKEDTVCTSQSKC